jgi:hypothetical protein
LGGSWFEISSGKQFVRSHLQNNQSKVDWRCSSSGRAPAGSNPSPTKKKKKKEKVPYQNKQFKKLFIVGNLKNNIFNSNYTNHGYQSLWIFYMLKSRCHDSLVFSTWIPTAVCIVDANSVHGWLGSLCCLRLKCNWLTSILNSVGKSRCLQVASI